MRGKRPSPTSRSNESDEAAKHSASQSDAARRARFRTEFGAALSVSLAERQMTQSDLATAANRSPSYTNQVMSGRKGASPEWVNLIADTMKLSKQERQKLHAAAARDHGYDIPDLSEDK
jgi:hypothetical protein